MPTSTENKLLIKELEKCFNPEQIEVILETLDSICSYCWDNLKPCQCWNDE